MRTRHMIYAPPGMTAVRAACGLLLGSKTFTSSQFESVTCNNCIRTHESRDRDTKGPGLVLGMMDWHYVPDSEVTS